MTIAQNSTSNDVELIGSRIGRVDPGNFANQTGTDTDDSTDEEETEDDGLFDEPTDDEGDPTGMPDHGEHDHQQDDNYALGGHVTRSGSV